MCLWTAFRDNGCEENGKERMFAICETERIKLEENKETEYFLQGMSVLDCNNVWVEHRGQEVKCLRRTDVE